MQKFICCFVDPVVENVSVCVCLGLARCFISKGVAVRCAGFTRVLLRTEVGPLTLWRGGGLRFSW